MVDNLVALELGGLQIQEDLQVQKKVLFFLFIIQIP